MSSQEDKLKTFAVQLFKRNAVKFGEFKTKVGLLTPIYVDLRVLVSYPDLMKTLAELLVIQIQKIDHVDILCGVPYTALPIATAVSISTGLPMVMRRKEAKDYGTKKLIEGVFNEGDRCLIVEDVVTSGSSVLETVKDLQNEGLKCKDAIVLINREQGGARFLADNGIKMHALYTLTELVQYLFEAECIDEKTKTKVRQYIVDNQVPETLLKKNAPAINRLKLSFEERSKYAKNVAAKKLFRLMADKQTTLCLAADLTDATKLLNLAEQVGPHICALKTHIDIIEDFNPNFIEALKDIARRHNFILFEDRKFADIGKTVQLQYTKGIYRISDWADLVTVHSLVGKGVLDAIKETHREVGVFLLAELSASGNLLNDSYVKATIKMADEYPDLVAGLVCQSPLFLDKPGFVQLTPGVSISAKRDNLGQQYNSPDNAVLERGADVCVVGRGITEASDPLVAAKLYKQALWESATRRIV